MHFDFVQLCLILLYSTSMHVDAFHLFRFCLILSYATQVAYVLGVSFHSRFVSPAVTTTYPCSQLPTQHHQYSGVYRASILRLHILHILLPNHPSFDPPLRALCLLVAGLTSFQDARAGHAGKAEANEQSQRALRNNAKMSFFVLSCSLYSAAHLPTY